jgi:HK97 family phage portal protein
VPELRQILRYANERETFADLLYVTICHIKLTGDAFWYKSEAFAGDRPKELFAINPKRVRIIPNKDGSIRGYLYRMDNGQETPFDQEEIIHFKRPHPDNDYHGLGDLEAGEELVGDWVNRQDWARQFWKHGASPSGLLICEDTVPDQEEWDRRKARWLDQYGGKNNAGKLAFLTGKWRFERIGLSSQEMQDLEKTKLSVEQIFQLMGIPLSVAGVRDAANYATAEIDDQRFRTYTVFPMVRIIQDTMNTDLVKGLGENLEIRFDVAGLVDIRKVVTDFAPLFDRGCVSINEMREKAGLTRVEGNPLFDQHFITAALVPLDLSGISAPGGVTEQEAERISREFTQKVIQERSAA